MSEVRIQNINTTIANIGKFQNITPVKGTIYAADGNVYTQLPVGANLQALTSDSTNPQGVSWQNYLNPLNPTISFNLFGCFGIIENNIYYNAFGTSPPTSNHANPCLMSFNYDTYIIAFGSKPRSDIGSGGAWCRPVGTNPTNFSGMWTGTLYIDIVGCSDSANPNLGLTPMANVPTPHFYINDVEIRSKTIFTSKYWIPPTPILVPARTKFTVRTSWAPGTIFVHPNDNHFLTGNLILRAIV